MYKDAEKLLQNMLAGWNNKDWDLLRSVHCDDWIDRSAPEKYNNLTSMENFFFDFTISFPDMKMEVNHAMYKADEIAYFYTISGTHMKDFLGFPAKKGKVKFTAMNILRLRDGKIAEAWGISDKILFLEQMRARKR